ncbi:Cysteine desulfurase related protein [Candidatus Koribacter versatilis Ellin345]|uniref:Cysteine desulfurase related protein n=1 Tax=Koribacter versatilis (strain Ellin345) TaxID=204669 RepID=Q1IIY4_KORVE|nr:cysteine desulfurase-like protein [Candidatus Koribacter versatilis]ABF43166.1 Cysteine desulfurase related protein [Candidatus Koribacter versatilis Ellin345]
MATSAHASVNLEAIRAQFPALSQTYNGHPRVYFDAPGGTQVPQQVIDAISGYLVHSNSNTHGQFHTSHLTDEVLEHAHAAMADMLGCDADEIVFGQNMTTLTFALSRALGRDLRAGDEIVTTLLDHDANVAPWRALEETGARVHAVKFHPEDCTLDLEDLQSKLNGRTKIVAVGFASNAVGTINPIKKIVEMAHAVGALVFVDAVHFAPHGFIDVRDLDCDFLACSTYKFFGPHMGVLFGKHEHLLRLKPYKVRPAADTLPDRWETGTLNHECIAGITACVEYLADVGLKTVKHPESRRDAIAAAYAWMKEHEHELARQLIGGLLEIPGLTFYGIRDLSRLDERTPTVSIRMAKLSPAELSKKLGDLGIYTWDGNFYAINVTEQLGVEEDGGILRIGLAHYATSAEVERLLKALREWA